MKLFSLAVAFLLNSAIDGAKVPRRELVQLKDECVAQVAVHEFDFILEPDLELVCGTPSGHQYTVPVDQDFIKENFIQGPYEPGKTRLSFPGGAMIDPNTATIITPDVHPRLSHDEGKDGPGVTAIGEFEYLVVKVIASDGSNSLSEDELADAVFGTYGDPVNIKSQYGLCSHGKNVVVESEDRSGTSTNISQGVVTITVDVSTSEGDAVMRNAVTSEINAQFGVSSPTALADHALYCLPPNTMGGIAYAFINSWMSVYSDTWCRPVSAQMHEVGHNIGLAHSNEAGEYKDQSGMMGFSYSGSDWPEMCFNAAKSWQLNWYSEKELLISEAGTDQYMGELASITEDVYDPSVPPMVVKLNKNTGNDYFLFFNKKVSFNQGTVEGGDQVLIVEQGSEGNGFAPSELLAKLSAGESWESPAEFGGETVTVTVEAISSRADVVICVGTCNFDPTASPAPTTCSECAAGEFEMQIDIMTDRWPTETDWTVTSSDGMVVMSGGDYSLQETLFTHEDCLPDGDYTFTITDSWGDGICCGWGDGYFEGYVNGELEFSGGQFGSSDTRDFSGESPCLVPDECVDSPLPVAGFGVFCDVVALYCNQDGAPSHCPSSCGACDTFGCEDSAVGWSLFGGDYTCAALASLDPADIDVYCAAFPQLVDTCRSTCGLCSP